MKNKTSKVLFWIFTSLFIFAAVNLVLIFYDLNKNQNEYIEIANKIRINDKITDWDSTENKVKFAPMVEINSDFIGWLSIKNTVLDYPVMYKPDDPEYYLSKNIYKEKSLGGAPFFAKGCNLNSNNIIIYGHNVYNGSMFNTLTKYESEKFYDEHPRFIFETMEGSYLYEIIAVFKERVHLQEETNVFRYYNYGGMLNEKEFNDYLENIKEISLYPISQTASYGDKLITLSTCHFSDKYARMVIVGVQKSILN